MANYVKIAQTLMPIYQRVYNPRKEHRLYCTERDIEEANDRLASLEDDGRMNTATSYLNVKEPESIIFIGDSHATHLKSLCDKHELPPYHDRFLGKAYFSAIGGLNWWIAEQNLNGRCLSAKKKEDYGNQWGQFCDLGIKVSMCAW